MLIHSPDFHHNASMPAEFTCDGDDISPTLIFEDVPEEAKSLVMIMDDPDAEFGRFVHWMVWNIPPQTRNLTDGEIPGGSVTGIGSSNFRGYVGPCPPSGTHHYEFHLYALDKMLDLGNDITREQLEKAIDGNVLAEAKLIGLYSK